MFTSKVLTISNCTQNTQRGKKTVAFPISKLTHTHPHTQTYKQTKHSHSKHDTRLLGDNRLRDSFHGVELIHTHTNKSFLNIESKNFELIFFCILFHCSYVPFLDERSPTTTTKKWFFFQFLDVIYLIRARCFYHRRQ